MIKNRNAISRQKILTELLKHKSGIYQSLLPDLINIGFLTVSKQLNIMVEEGLIIKIPSGKTFRIVPNIEAIQHAIQSEDNAKSQKTKQVKELISNDPAPIEPGKSIIKLYPDEFWVMEYIAPPINDIDPKIEYGKQHPDKNWTYEIENLFRFTPEEEINIAIERLSQNAENGKKLNLNELLKSCKILPKETTNFLKMIAVLHNDEKAQKARNNEIINAKLIVQLTIEDVGSEKYVNIETASMT